jgi:probable rRNA maturation factor
VIILKKSIAGVSETSLARFLARAKRAAGLRERVVVLITGNRELRELNCRFRGQDRPTDVLSFPAAPEAASQFAGDLAISADIAAANAQRLGHPPATELKILMLHGLLHLAGYDHENDNGAMARREARLRLELRLPETLIERAAAQGAIRGRPAKDAVRRKNREHSSTPAGKPATARRS